MAKVVEVAGQAKCYDLEVTLTDNGPGDLDPRPHVILGTPGPDVILGTDAADAIDGNGGEDVITTPPNTSAGTFHQIRGGPGVRPGTSARPLRLEGGPGNDRLIGGPHPDVLDVGEGQDTCVGGGGQDTFLGCERTSAAPDLGDDAD